jgi:hypothetical protein
MDVARRAMGDIGVLGDVLPLYHRVARTSGQNGCGHLDWHISHSSYHQAILPAFHAHRGLPHMVLLC